MQQQSIWGEDYLHTYYDKLMIMFKKYHAFAFVEKRSNELCKLCSPSLNRKNAWIWDRESRWWMIDSWGNERKKLFFHYAVCVKKEVRPRALPFVIFCKLELLDNKYTSRFDIGQPHKFLFFNAYEQHQWVNSLASFSPFRLSSFLPVQSICQISPTHVYTLQGDPSGCSLGFVDIKQRLRFSKCSPY